MSSSRVEVNLDRGAVGNEKNDGDESVCHLLPCRIEHKGLEVKAKEYFWPTVRELKIGGDDDQGRKVKHEQLLDETNNTKEQPILTASFRGRPLQGRHLKLPDGFAGHVLDKPGGNAAFGKLGAKSATIAKHFDTFTYWNWDELPSKDDSVVKALGWLNVAKAIHEPI